MRERLLHSFLKMAGIGALAALVLTLGVTVNAQCGGVFNSMMAAASIGGRSKLPQPMFETKNAPSDLLTDRSVNTSIVGLWHIRFFVDTPGGPLMIQEAFQTWNTGGTEVHNPNVDPRGGSVCLGAWIEAAPQTFKLTHRVWLYDANGNFQAIGHLTESLTLSDRGNTHSGTFTLQAFDAEGNPLGGPAVGTVIGERISPN